MTNKTAFITGSAKRIGACTARHLHAKGYNIVLHCNHSKKAGEALADSLNAERAGSAVLLQADLCNPEEVDRLAEHVPTVFGRVDALINNASSFYPTEIGTITLQDWQTLFGSNALAPLFLSQGLFPALKQTGGSIVNMVDIHAEKPLRHHTVYCMAKAALVTMTQSLAQEMAPKVRVNGIAPGAILWPDTPLSDEEKSAVLDQVPAARLGEPEDIAASIAFLLEAGYVSGQILAVDGGRSVASSAKA